MTAPVYQGYGQERLDAQYNQRTLVPDVQRYFERWRRDGERVGGDLMPQADVPFGADPVETVDIFRPAEPACGLHVHYHGGAWRALSSRDAWFIAPAWVAAGYIFVSVNFGLVPAVSLARQVDQARRALFWAGDNAAEIGAGADRITLSGHSSGGYLAAMAGLVDWGGRRQPEVQGVIMASGVYDLEPVQLSGRNEYLKLSAGEALDLSPIRHLKERTPPCSIIWSENELDEFRRQSALFADRLEPRGPVRRYPSRVSNHFDSWDLVTPEKLSAQN